MIKIRPVYKINLHIEQIKKSLGGAILEVSKLEDYYEKFEGIKEFNKMELVKMKQLKSIQKKPLKINDKISLFEM